MIHGNRGFLRGSGGVRESTAPKLTLDEPAWVDGKSLASNPAVITFSAFSSEEAMKIDNCDLLFSSASCK